MFFNGPMWNHNNWIGVMNSQIVLCYCIEFYITHLVVPFSFFADSHPTIKVARVQQSRNITIHKQEPLYIHTSVPKEQYTQHSTTNIAQKEPTIYIQIYDCHNKMNYSTGPRVMLLCWNNWFPVSRQIAISLTLKKKYT